MEKEVGNTRKYCNNFDLNRITNNEKFWKAVKPLLFNNGKNLKKSL